MIDMSRVGHLFRTGVDRIRQAMAKYDVYQDLWRVGSTALKKVQEEGYENKVFGVGLSRTGTTSLAYALRELGLSTLDWIENGRIPWLEDFYRFDAVTDTPCAAQFEQLYYAFPESRFIYTVREIGDWRRSIVNHFGEITPGNVVSHYHNHYQGCAGTQIANKLRWIFIHENLYGGHETWEEAYRAFDNRINAFFEERDGSRLLVLNITGSDGWPELCQFLNEEEPDVAFPHKNRTEAG